MNNKHPHHDLIVEWAKDTSKQVQILDDDDTDLEYWCDCYNPTWDIRSKYRFKPREFIKGHWYPCYEAKGDFSLKVSDGRGFYTSSDYSSIVFYEAEFAFIGKSLGEIKFNG